MKVHYTDAPITKSDFWAGHPPEAKEAAPAPIPIHAAVARVRADYSVVEVSVFGELFERRVTGEDHSAVAEIQSGLLNAHFAAEWSKYVDATEAEL